MDLDTARQDPVDIDDARAKFVIWSRKEFYANADVKAERLILPPAPFGHMWLGISKKQQEVEIARMNEAHRARQAECDRLRAEWEERRKPLLWLQAEAQYYRVTFSSWITALELGGSAARIESIRAALETAVLKEA